MVHMIYKVITTFSEYSYECHKIERTWLLISVEMQYILIYIAKLKWVLITFLVRNGPMH